MKTQYKIKDILTKEYIRVLIPLIIENYKCEIDPKTLRKINDILDDKEVIIETTQDIIVWEENGWSTGLIIEMTEQLGKHFQEVALCSENSFGENETEKIKLSYRIVEKVYNVEKKGLAGLESIKQRYDEPKKEIDSNVTISEMIEIANEEQMSIIVGFFINDEFLKNSLKDFREFIDKCLKPMVKFVQDFCNANDISIEIKNILLKIVFLHAQLVELMIEHYKWLLIANSDFKEVLDCYGNWFVNDNNRDKIGIKPQLKGFTQHLIHNVDKVDNVYNDDFLKRHLVKYVRLEGDKMKTYFEEEQALIDITPHQTLSIEAAAANVEEGKEERTFDDLFPSIEDKEMVMKMLVGLKIINSEGKYLLGSKRGIIRVFIDVMKEEGYFIDIDRKPILRIFTPVILNKLVEKINKPLDSDVMERRIIKKLSELRK